VGRDSQSQCLLCSAPKPIRDLAEQLRTIGLSLRDVASCIKVTKDFSLSYSAVGRHDPHWEKQKHQADMSGESPYTGPEQITVQKVALHKLNLYWQMNKEVVPSDNEARAWMKLLSEIQNNETEAEKMSMLRQMFRPVPALPSGDVIEGEVLN
jgi:hypothetical protein